MTASMGTSRLDFRRPNLSGPDLSGPDLSRADAAPIPRWGDLYRATLSHPDLPLELLPSLAQI